MAHIGEVDARRLYLREATPSMFVYCTERLHLSETEACLRIAAARAARRHPGILEMLADGRLHRSAIAKLAPHVTPENRDELLRRATHRTKREVEELVAEIAPQPDVAATIRKLPAGRLAVRTARQSVTLDGLAAREQGRELRAEQVDSERLEGTNACSAYLRPRDDPSRKLERTEESGSCPGYKAESSAVARSTSEVPAGEVAAGIEAPAGSEAPQ